MRIPMKHQTLFVPLVLFGMCGMLIIGVAIAADVHVAQQSSLSFFSVSGSATEKEKKEPETAAPLQGPSSTAKEGEEEDEKEETVSWQEVPDAVKATILLEILREMDDLVLEELEREEENGKIVYEAEFAYKDKHIELEIGAQGDFIEKEVKLKDDDDNKENE